jgi:hypothetical protein
MTGRIFTIAPAVGVAWLIHTFGYHIMKGI